MLSIRPYWPVVIGGIVVLAVATINSFVHTAEGWTVVVPYGLALSAAPVLAMINTAWLAHLRIARVTTATAIPRSGDGHGQGQGGWFGDPRGRSEAARRGWKTRRGADDHYFSRARRGHR